MNQEILNILFSAIGVIVTGLASFAVAKLTQWINTKISNNKTSNMLNNIVTIVGNCVQETYQTYVESLKENGSFDAEAQKKALNMCLDKIKSQMVPDVLEYIANNFGDIDGYIVSIIESTIYSLKNK